jgi:hypothetical protein
MKACRYCGEPLDRIVVDLGSSPRSTPDSKVISDGCQWATTTKRETCSATSPARAPERATTT